MKILRLTLWSVVIIILVVMLILGLTGRLSKVFPHSDFSFNIGNTLNYPDSELYSVGGGSADTQEVSSIELHWISGDVKVIEYGGEDIKFSETSTYTMEEKDQMRYYVNNGRLMIQFSAPGNFDIFGDVRGKSLTVYVPKGFEMDDLIIDTVSASIDVQKLKAAYAKIESVSGTVYALDIVSDDLTLESTSGNITAQTCSAKSLATEEVSGSLDVEGEFAKVSCDTVSGNTKVSPGSNILKIDIKSVSGEITVELPENNGFTAKYDSVSGEFTCGFPVLTGKDSVTYGNGNADFRLETVSGDIEIVKK